MTYLRLIFTMPRRAWGWGQLHPFSAIGYGLVLLGAAYLSRLVIVIIAAAAILSGLTALFRPNL